VLTPFVFVVLVPTWVIISKATKTAALASLIVLCAIPVGVWATGRELWEIPSSIGIAVLIALRHVSNIQRMQRGSELRL
jgi:glycerol-3-phosphate acyltransferase PlsY